MSQVVYYYTEVPVKSGKKETKRRAVFAGLFDDESNKLKIGLAQCSKKDQFVKKVGRVKATGRANGRPFAEVNLPNDLVKPHQFFIDSVKIILKTRF